MRKVLGVNISHNCSFAYFEDKVLKEYYEEDRFNKIKAYTPDANEPEYEYEVLKKFKNITFDTIVFSTYDRGYAQLDQPIVDNCLNQLKYNEYQFNNRQHHIYHAVCGYYFSKFDEAIAVVSDGGGETVISPQFRTLQSIFTINKKEVNPLFKHASNGRHDYFNNFVDASELHKVNDIDFLITNRKVGGLKYLNYLTDAGFEYGEEGQMMGMAAYINEITTLDKEVLKIANKAQKETLQEAIELIYKAKEYSECKNIILSGGYHLNCSNNFKLVKHFPEYNFFVDPIPYDGGTAVGAAYLYENFKN
jgi:predicted NodU family carbamoyl transferase